MNRFLTLVCCGLLLGACESKDESDPAATSAVSQETTAAEPHSESASAPESQAETATAERWMPVDDNMNQAQQAQLDRAKAAQKELGQSLVKALTGSIAKDGHAKSIDFCKKEAPVITEKVAETQGVKIGRTSSKLRNPANSGAVWTANATDVAGEKQGVFAGPNGELGLIVPIPTAELCTSCHGDETAVSPEVATALEKSYPNDQARGFKEGDLRGWFWVEVPPPS